MRIRVVALAVVAIGFSTVSEPVAAQAAKRAFFDGSCELSGVARFDHPVTNNVEPNGGTFRTQPGLGNCIGTLRVGNRTLGTQEWAVRARARARGDFSCLSGSLGGRAVTLFLGEDGKPLRVRGRRVRVRGLIAMAHAVAAGSIEFLGGRGSTAGGVYNFTPSGGAVAGCAQNGDKSLPMAVRFTTRGEFASLRRRR